MGIHKKTRKSIRKPRKTNKSRKSRKYKKTIRRRSRKFTGGDLVFTPDDESIRQAIREYSSNRTNNAAIARYGKMKDWNTINVTDMNGLFRMYIFKNMDEFIGNWDVSNVTDMSSIFFGCNNFNQPLNNWNVSNVTNMKWMFYRCYKFNQPLNNWNVSNVRDMSGMFSGCRIFNQPLDNWNVSSVKAMREMFINCYQFNQPLNNWNVSRVVDMSSMFFSCTNFNQPLDNWNVSRVVDMSSMFNHCLSYVVLPTWYQGPQHQQQQPSQLLQQQRIQQVRRQEPELFQYASVEPEQIDKKNTIDITGKTVFDFIMYEDVPITEYLQENSDAIVFYYLGKFYAVKKGELEKAVIDKSFVKYVCPVTGSMRDIVKTVPYLYGRALGIECGLIKLSQIKQLIESNIKYVEIVKTDEYAKSTASLSMLLPGANAVGASHCQEGQDAPIVKLYTFELVTKV